MKYELKSIGIWSFIKVSFFFNLVVGFLVGLLYGMFFGVFYSIMQNMPYMDSGELPPPPDIPFGAVMLILPFFFAIGGAIFYTLFGTICAGLYNFIAKLTGGIEYNVSAVAEYVSPQQPQTQLQPLTPLPPPPAMEAPKSVPTSFELPQPPIEKTGNDEKPPDPGFPSRTVGG